MCSKKILSTEKRTTHIVMPTRISDGEIDKRYKNPQFIKTNGTRDMRTKKMCELKEKKKTVKAKKSTTRGTTDVHIPEKNDGTADKRYKTPQVCNADGKRDKRVTKISDRKS